MPSKNKSLSLKKIELDQSIDLLLSFKLDTHIASYGTHEGYRPEAYIERLKKRHIDYPEGQIFLVSGRRIIGQLGYYPEETTFGRWGYIHMLYIVPEERGKGLGKYLLGKAIDHFRERGINTVALRVSSLNPQAMSLYASMGFTQHLDQKLSTEPMVLLVRKKGVEDH